MARSSYITRVVAGSSYFTWKESSSFTQVVAESSYFTRKKSSYFTRIPSISLAAPVKKVAGSAGAIPCRRVHALTSNLLGPDLLLAPDHQVSLHGVGVLPVSVVLRLDLADPGREESPSVARATGAPVKLVQLYNKFIIATCATEEHMEQYNPCSSATYAAVLTGSGAPACRG